MRTLATIPERQLATMTTASQLVGSTRRGSKNTNGISPSNRLFICINRGEPVSV
jgi:hypothetical protein